jgi:hypothetical protein
MLPTMSRDDQWILLVVVVGHDIHHGRYHSTWWIHPYRSGLDPFTYLISLVILLLYISHGENYKVAQYIIETISIIKPNVNGQLQTIKCGWQQRHGAWGEIRNCWHGVRGSAEECIISKC